MKNSWASKYLSNLRLIIFAYLLIIFLGVYAWFNLPRELMPSINLPIIIVSTVLPQSSPNDVEELITIPLEDKIRGIKGIDTVLASSIDGASLMMVQFEKNINADNALREIEQKVNATVLPTQALKPTITKVDFSEFPVWSFTLEGQDRLGLERVADLLKKELEKLSTIDRVETAGFGDREIVVLFNQEKINQAGLSPFLLSPIINSLTANQPLGKVATDNFIYTLGINKQISDADSLRSTLIAVNGKSYQLGELATVYEQDKLDKSSAYQMDNSGKLSEVVSFNVYKTPGSPVDKNAKISQETAQRLLANYPQFTLRSLTDFGQEIKDTFSELEANIITTAILVFLIMFLFLGIKEAIIATTSIPMVMLFTFIGIIYFDLSLNFISLFSLLLALGMLVDNAIVVTTALSREYAKNPRPLEAGIRVWREYFLALIATNLTTVWAFLPLLLMSGVMGVFLKTLSIVVTLAILGSAVIAFLLTLPLGIFLLNPQIPTRVQKFFFFATLLVFSLLVLTLLPKNLLAIIIVPLCWLLLYLLIILRPNLLAKIKHSNKIMSRLKNKLRHGIIKTELLENAYRRLLVKLLSNQRWCKRLLLAIICTTICAFALPILGQIQNEFFPPEDNDYLEMQLILPMGTDQENVKAAAQKLLTELTTLPYIDYVTAQTNRGSSANLVSASSNENKILFTLNFAKDKPLASYKLAAQLREKYSFYPDGQILVLEDSSGPTGEADLQLSIAGDDLAILSDKAQAIVAWLKNQPGVSDISSTSDDISPRLIFEPDQEKLLAYGLGQQQVNTYLYTLVNGYTLGKITKDNQEMEINYRLYNNNPQLEQLMNTTIPTSMGQEVALSSLGKLQLKPSLAQISRNDYKRVVTIKASIDQGYQVSRISQQLNKFINDELNLENGYYPISQGANQTNQEAVGEIYLSMGLAGFLILFTLVMQMRSFRKAFIIMTVIPVAISGVFLVFALFGLKLSLPAFIGILALFGIVVNNSILIIERINQNLAAGENFTESIINGSVQRLQPILLTSLTTIIGLIPITLSKPMWQGLGGAIIAGLIFSGALLLLYIPVLFALMFNPAKLALKDKRWHSWWQEHA